MVKSCLSFREKAQRSFLAKDAAKNGGDARFKYKYVGGMGKLDQKVEQGYVNVGQRLKRTFSTEAGAGGGRGAS